MKQDEEYWSYYTPAKRARLEQEYIKVAVHLAEYLLKHAPVEFIKIAAKLPPKLLAQNLEAGQLVLVARYLNTEELTALAVELTDEQFEAFVRHLRPTKKQSGD